MGDTLWNSLQENETCIEDRKQATEYSVCPRVRSSKCEWVSLMGAIGGGAVLPWRLPEEEGFELLP